MPEFFSKSDNVAMGILNTAEDDAEGNSLAGAILYEPFGDVEVDASKLEVSTSEPISAMMTTCRSRFLLALQERNPSLTEEQRASLKCGYIGWMAVHSSQRRKGICLTLVQQATREMALAGMSFIIAYCTSPKSRAVFLKAGYEVWAEVRYATFQVRENKYPGGEFPYRNVPDEVSIMVKDLRHALND